MLRQRCPRYEADDTETEQMILKQTLQIIKHASLNEINSLSTECSKIVFKKI